MVGTILITLVVGAIIGLVTRLVMPGRQNIGLLMTVLLGAAGGLLGSAIVSHFGYVNANGGIAWVPFFVGVGLAIVFIAVYEAMTGRRTRTRTGMFR